ncbi:MAG: choice-of-anchor tandem repeat GloVer-containing protein [Luteolibacter sp.]
MALPRNAKHPFWLCAGLGRALVWGIAVMAGCLGGANASISYEVLGSFQKPGTQVVAPLLSHSDGNFYGVASASGIYDLGTVFKITPAGVLTTLYSFSGIDGSGPASKLTEGTDHALYGTTPSGGTNGFGIAFKVTTTGIFTKLVDFTGTSGSARGSVPDALVLHADTNFYGVTQAGGTGGFGTVFKMTSAGVVTTLLDFTGNTGLRPGSQPQGPLAVSDSLLYGVTKLGGAVGLGCIFELSTSGTWRSLGEFTGTSGVRPGSNPAGGLLFDAGVLYGTTELGGTNSFGVAFKTTAVTTPVYTVLRNFADLTGTQPSGTLVKGTDGLLYGATVNGGVNGLGTVYKITTAGAHTLLASFTGETGVAPGSAMRGGLVLGSANFYYGVTGSGGPGNLGVAFKISSTGTFTSLAPLSPAAGWLPSGAPVASGTGTLLFPIAAGGASGCGNLMSVATNGAISVAAAFDTTLGTAPDGGLKSAGPVFYGVSSKGGASARGTMFRYTPGIGMALVSTHSTSAGSLAEGPLALGADGLYYGIGREGGASLKGTIFKVTTTGTRTRLVSFTGTAGAATGAKPRGPLVLAADGNFYGLTEEGGAANTGVIFQLSAAGAYVVIDAFAATGPRSPQGGFVVGNDGLLYATTSAGGAADFGTLIRFTPATGIWEVIGEFSGASGLSPGALPGGEMMVASDGSIYGTAVLGGAADEGVVFRYATGKGLQALVQFSGLVGATPGSAGAADAAGLVFTGGLSFGTDGLLYGVAPSGGPDGGGVVYRITIPPPMSEWKSLYLGSPNAPDLDDFDRDGSTNLMEYALLTQPQIPDPAALPAPAITQFPDGVRLAIAVPRDPARTDINLIVEVSETLLPLSWSALASSIAGGVFSGPGYYSGDTASPGAKLAIIRDTQALSASSRRFIRIRATH